MKAAWIGAVVLVGGVGLGVRGGCFRSTTQAPDERLAGNLSDLCEIARGNVASPERGVQRLGRYLNKHADDMLGAFGSTLAHVERIADDDKHDARARLARERIQAPLRACERDWDRFAQAVEKDPKAKAALERGVDRLGRTLEIILSSTEATRFDLRELPRRLGAAVD